MTFRTWGARAGVALLVLLGLVALDRGVGWLSPAPGRLEEILEIFEIHPTRLWTLRRNLATRFQGAVLQTDREGWRVTGAVASERADEAPAVYCMGDSLTFGWGVGDVEAWPAVLQAKTGLRVRNASVPGYTTWQGSHLLDEVLPRHPEVVLLAYGVNDVSKMRFFASDVRPDAEQHPRNPLAVFLLNGMMETSTYRFLRNRTFRAREQASDGMAAMMRMSDAASPRVGPEEFTTNLEGMLARARGAGVDVMLVKMPLNLPLPPLVSADQKRAAAESFADATRRRARGDARGALESYLKGLREDPLDRARCWEAYALGQESGDETATRSVLELLKRQEVYSASALHVEYNRRVDEVASRTRVPLVDVEKAFADARRRAGATAVDLFNDAVRDPYHPNPAGHELIAEAVASALRERAQAVRVRR